MSYWIGDHCVFSLGGFAEAPAIEEVGTYKLLGECDENSATDIAALMNAVERLAVSTSAAVALANHYEVLGDQRLTSTEWQAKCAEEMGVGEATFYKLLKVVQHGEQVLKSVIDRKWERIRKSSRNSNNENNQ